MDINQNSIQGPSEPQSNQLSTPSKKKIIIRVGISLLAGVAAFFICFYGAKALFSPKHTADYLDDDDEIVADKHSDSASLPLFAAQQSITEQQLSFVDSLLSAGNYSEAIDLCLNSPNPSDPQILNTLAYVYFSMGNYDNANRIWQENANLNNDAHAQYNIGYSYYQGEGGYKCDFDKAVYWLQKSANQNHPQALYQLGCCYFYGLGVETDTNKAIYYIKKAAALGYQSAIDYLNENSNSSPQ